MGGGFEGPVLPKPETLNPGFYELGCPGSRELDAQVGLMVELMSRFEISNILPPNPKPEPLNPKHPKP